MKKILVMASVMMLGASGAWALGTVAGTDINNSATLSYSAGGVNQPDVSTQTPDTFKVDKKVDMVLEINNANHASGALGQHNVVTSFSFKNEGNSNERFNFHVTNMSGGSSDNTDSVPDDTQNVSDLNITCNYKNENNADKTKSSVNFGEDIVIYTYVDSSATCTVSATLPTGVFDGSVMNIELNATAYKDDTTAETETGDANGKDRQGIVDVVFADGVDHGTLGYDGNNDGSDDDNASSKDTAGDGSDVAVNGYIIKTPVLSVVKTSCVISDPVNGTSDTRKRIPGAVIRYMFDIDNQGTGDVDDLNISDHLSDKFVFDGANVKVTNPKKKENKGTEADTCQCGTAPATPISGDTGILNRDLLIQKIDVAHGSVTGTAGHNHTCVSVEVEID